MDTALAIAGPAGCRRANRRRPADRNSDTWAGSRSPLAAATTEIAPQCHRRARPELPREYVADRGVPFNQVRHGSGPLSSTPPRTRFVGQSADDRYLDQRQDVVGRAAGGATSTQSPPCRCARSQASVSALMPADPRWVNRAQVDHQRRYAGAAFDGDLAIQRRCGA